MRSEIPKPPVEERTSRDLRRVECIETLREMERLFADEALTAGLNEACALKILTWAGREIEVASHLPHQFREVAQAIRDHARLVGTIAQMMTVSTDTPLLRERLLESFPALPTNDLFSDVEEAIEIRALRQIVM